MKIRLLLSTQRSGSHFLKSLLEAHFSGVVCSGEILNKPAVVDAKRISARPNAEVPYFWTWYEAEVIAGRLSLAPDQKMAAFEKYLDVLAPADATDDLVLDVKYNTIRTLSGYWDSEYGSGDFVSFISNRKMPVLHLVRRNLFRLYISDLLAQQTGIWHRYAERSQDEPLPRLRIDFRSLLVHMRYWMSVTEDYRRRLKGQPGYLEIGYEDLVAERESGSFGPSFGTLGSFLEKSPTRTQPVPLRFKKTTPEDPAQVVENWDEICRMLRKTEYGWMAETPFQAAA
jgi:hypothetical protein